MTRPLQDELEANIRRVQTMVQTTNEATAQKFADMAALVAVRGGLPEAVASKEFDRVRPMAVQLMKDAHSDFITISDEKGIVVARGHSPKFKDDVTNQETVVMAMQGKPSVCVVSGTEVPFTIRASNPIILDGKLVGTHSIGTSLVSPAYLDWLKTMGGMEVTIFKGDTRVMTTIKNDRNQRILGTKMETPEILQKVLRDGQVLFTENTIQGTRYKSAYWPVRDLNNKIVGMWFIGAPISTLMANEQQALNITLMVSGGLLLVMLALVTLVGMAVAAPIKKIARYATEVESGNNNAVLEVRGNDDMGELANVLRSMVDKLKAQTRWYQDILNCIPFSVSITDMNKKWLFLNATGLQSIKKKDLTEIMGKPCSDRNGPLCGTANCGIENLRRGCHEVRCEQPDGRIEMVRLEYLTDEKGDHIGHVEISVDITEQERFRSEAAEAEKRARHHVAQQLEAVLVSLDGATRSLSTALERATDDAQATAQRMGDAASAMDQMTATVRDVARNAGNAAQDAEGARQQAHQGEVIVEQVVNGIQSVQNTSEALKTDMGELDIQARNIGTVLVMIRDIADQTNLLALNAAIEAARAGEAGRGFAVVADEVRKLAEKSMAATKDVEQAIASIQDGTAKSARTVEAAVQAIGEATGRAQKSGEALHGIVTLSVAASERVQAIAAAAEEQSVTTDHVSSTVESTTQLAIQLSEAMQGAAQAVGEMQRQAEVLHKVVAELKA